MWGSASFLDELRSEVWDRYHALTARYGAERVPRPSIALLGALAEVTAPIRTRTDSQAVRDAARYAGETYEYLVERWQDPRWQEVVTVAIAVGLPGLRGRKSESTTEPKRRRAGIFHTDEFQTTGSVTSARPSLAPEPA